jgi:hypothetical protein
MVMFYLIFKQISVFNENEFELWDVCRFQKTGSSHLKNITKNSIKKIIEIYLSKNQSCKIWLSVYINDIQKAIKLINLYSDIGFTIGNICSPNILSPSGIKLIEDYERMYLNKNTVMLNQTIRNVSNFIWDYNCFYNKTVKFYLSRKLVNLLKYSLNSIHEHGFGFYMNLREATSISNCKISLIKGSEVYNAVNYTDTFEFNKNCSIPPLTINTFAHIHTHPKVCYNSPEGDIKIDPFSFFDIKVMLENNYRFMLTPSIEGLHFIKLREKVRNYIYMESDDPVKFINSVFTKYKDVFVPKILKFILQKNISQIEAIDFYSKTLYEDFNLEDDKTHIFFYKLIEWKDSNINLYDNNIII